MRRGAFTEYAPVVDHIPLSQGFLKRQLDRADADGLIAIYAHGNTMAPTIRHGDLLLIDTTQGQWTDGILACASDYGFWIRRVRVDPDGIEVSPDNPEDRERGRLTIGHNAMYPFKVVGRIVWIGRPL